MQTDFMKTQSNEELIRILTDHPLTLKDRSFIDLMRINVDLGYDLSTEEQNQIYEIGKKYLC